MSPLVILSVVGVYGMSAMGPALGWVFSIFCDLVWGRGVQKCTGLPLVGEESQREAEDGGSDVRNRGLCDWSMTIQWHWMVAGVRAGGVMQKGQPGLGGQSP